MTAWRVIITDSEFADGIAPVCPQPDVHWMHGGGPGGPDDPWVYDECCSGPHIECSSERAAKAIAMALTEAGAEVCS